MRGEDIYYLWITNHWASSEAERESDNAGQVVTAGSCLVTPMFLLAGHDIITLSRVKSQWQGLQLSPVGTMPGGDPANEAVQTSDQWPVPGQGQAYYCERPPLASGAAQHLSEDTLCGSDPVNINKKSLGVGSEMLDGHFIISISPFFAGHHISARWQLSQVWTEDCNVFLVIRGLLTNTDHGQSEYLCTIAHYK